MWERTYSRRKVLLGSVFGGVSLFGADRILKDGWMLKSPDLTPKPKRINLVQRGVSLNPNVTIGLDNVPKPLRINDRTYVYFNTDDDLIFQHEDAAFEEGKRYMVSHRAGNMRTRVDEALELGANGIDMDVVFREDGEMIASHGYVEEIGIGPINIGGAVDPTEIGVRTRIPRTAPDMLDYIGSRSTPESPLIITMELKRKSLSSQKALNNFIAGITRNGLPTWVFSSNQEAVDNLYGACEDYARAYGPTA